MDTTHSINEVANSINHLTQVIQLTQNHWWDTQWFSAVIGAATGFLGTSIYSSLKNRNRKLFDFYQWLLEQATFSDPDGLLKQSLMTSYQGDDKPLGEKMVIELRSHIKFWYEPFSKIRLLFGCYENALRKIKSGKREEVIQQEEYKEAGRKFEKIMKLVYQKTGENEWTS